MMEMTDHCKDDDMICWCSQVTAGDIRRSIQEQGAASVKDVIRLTGAMQDCDCAVKNPKGT